MALHSSTPARTPTRYLVYLSHNDDWVGGLVYESETYPDCEAIEAAYPMFTLATVVEACVEGAWVGVYDHT